MTTDEARVLAEEVALRHVSDAEPGIRRIRRGRGFSYVTPDGTTLQGEDRAALEALAIPPAWEDVWICPDADGHIRATGRDAQGRKQYVYHPAWERVRDRVKFARLADFGAGLPELRRQVDADLRRRGVPREKVVALAVTLLDETLLRVGNEAYAAQNGSYGLTTLEAGHVDLGATYIEFEFTGKGGAERRLRVSDRRLARLVAQCHELPGQRLFTYEDGGEVRAVGSGDVNAYLLDHMGEGLHGQGLPHLGRQRRRRRVPGAAARRRAERAGARPGARGVRPRRRPPRQHPRGGPHVVRAPPHTRGVPLGRAPRRLEAHPRRPPPRPRGKAPHQAPVSAGASTLGGCCRTRPEQSCAAGPRACSRA